MGFCATSICLPYHSLILAEVSRLFAPYTRQAGGVVGWSRKPWRANNQTHLHNPVPRLCDSIFYYISQFANVQAHVQTGVIY